MKSKGSSMRAALCLGAVGGMLLASIASAQDVDAVLSGEQQRVQLAQANQDQVDGIVDQTQKLLQQYRQVVKEVEGLQVYNTLLERQIANQKQQMTDLNNSIDQVTVIQRQIVPLMTRMIDGLAQFVDLDVPFLLDERHDRVQRLRDLLDRSDVSVAEKFRNVMQAWQIENDYGRTIESYSGTLQVEGSERAVDFLRVGRVALLFQTPDQSITGMYDKKTRKFVTVDDSYRNRVRAGLQMAKQQIAPDLLILPMPAPTEG